MLHVPFVLRILRLKIVISENGKNACLLFLELKVQP